VTTILSGGLDEAQQNELLTVVNEEADRMNHLVEEAMQLARLESKQVELDLMSHAIREAVEKAVTSAKKDLANHPVELALAADLPPAEFDLGLIVNVLQQLLENAAKYSPPNSPIRISAESSGEEVSISVADRGAGIDEFEQALIFDKFYRGKGSRSSVQGTGMGLAIAKAVLDAHGGSIRVTSQLGQGSVFAVALPLRKVNVAP